MTALGHKRTSSALLIYVRFRGLSRHPMSAFRGLFCRLLSRPDDAVYARPSDPQASGYLRSSNALVFKSHDLFPVDSWFAASINAPLFRLCDPLHLPFTAKVGLKLSKDT